MAKKKNLEKTEDKSSYVVQREKIRKTLTIHERDDLTDRQKNILEIIENKNTKIVFIDGPAGTSKTFLAVLAGLKLLNERKLSDLVYVRTIIESASKSLGSLPGEIDEKFGPFIAPLNDKLEEFLDAEDIHYLYKEGRVQAKPINYLRGASINAKYVLVDEAQNFTYKELVTVITRIGEFARFVFVGDTFQSDINGNSGFQKIFDIFNNEESLNNGIVCLKLTKEDIVRSGILKFIMEKLEEDKRYNK